MSTNPAYALPAQKPPHHNSNISSAVGNSSSGVIGIGVNMASGESKIAANQKPVAHTSLDVSGTTAALTTLTTSTATAQAANNGQNWTDELDSPLWLSSLHSVIFIITCALAVFILFRNVLTW